MKKKANTTQFFYQNGKLVTVSQAGQQRTILRNAELPLAELTQGDSQGAALLETDQSGSVLAVQGDSEDEEHHCYTVYGHNPSLPSRRTMIGFNGESIESTLKCYLLGNGYRSYSPHILRFVSPDLLSPFDAGGLNAYAYAECDPINNIDPSGQSIIKAFQNIAMHRKDKKINRITTHNSGIAENNDLIQRLHPNRYRDSTRINIYNLYDNSKTINKLDSSYRGTISPKDVAYAKKHDIPITTTRTDKDGIIADTRALMESHKTELSEHHERIIKLNVPPVAKAKKIRNTDAPVRNHGIGRLFGGSHPNNRHGDQ